MRIDMGFARRDDCLDRMVPSDLRLLVGERDRLEAENKALKEELEALRSRVVIVPEQREPRTLFAVEEACDAGWNACLDELARLNGKTVSEGLLRKCCSEDQTLRNTACRTLRALLDEGKGVAS